MNAKRNGKIARLPRLIREKLNARLADGEEGDSLLAWLHRLPAVWTVLERDFAGVRITKQNLSEWRQGGYAEWETRLEVLEEARELAGDGEDLRLLTKGRLADALATMLTARYAALIRNWDGEVAEGFERKLKTLRGLCQDITALQRGEQRQSKLEMARTEWDEGRADVQEEVVGMFEQWVDHPGVRRVLDDKRLTKGTRRQRLLEVFGLAPETQAEETEAEDEEYEKAEDEEYEEEEVVAPSPSQSKQFGGTEGEGKAAKCEEENENEEELKAVAPSPSQSNHSGPMKNEEGRMNKAGEPIVPGPVQTAPAGHSPHQPVAPSPSHSNQFCGTEGDDQTSESEGDDGYREEEEVTKVGKAEAVNPEDEKPSPERRKMFFRDRDLSDAEWRRKYHFD